MGILAIKRCECMIDVIGDSIYLIFETDSYGYDTYKLYGATLSESEAKELCKIIAISDTEFSDVRTIGYKKIPLVDKREYMLIDKKALYCFEKEIQSCRSVDFGCCAEFGYFNKEYAVKRGKELIERYRLSKESGYNLIAENCYCKLNVYASLPKIDKNI